MLTKRVKILGIPLLFSSKCVPDESERQLMGGDANRVAKIEGENCALVAAERGLRP